VLPLSLTAALYCTCVSSQHSQHTAKHAPPPHPLPAGIIVGTVPEGLLVTLTVSLALSAKNMYAKNVLVKVRQGAGCGSRNGGRAKQSRGRARARRAKLGRVVAGWLQRLLQGPAAVTASVCFTYKGGLVA